MKTLYFLDPQYINFDFTMQQVSIKHERNKNIKDNDKNFSILYYVIKLESGVIIGILDINHFEYCRAIGFGLFIGQKYSGKGYRTNVINTIIEFLKKNKISKKELKWECYSNNEASVRLAKKCGFVYDPDCDMEVYDDQISCVFKMILEH